MTDGRTRVWGKMAAEHPEFTRAHDPLDDYSMIDTLILGDFIAWRPFSGARVMDIGANVGVWTAYCALNGADVTAYEADPITHGIMSSMLIRNNLKVNAVNAALWTHTGQILFKGKGIESHYRNGAVQVPEHDGFAGNLGQEADMITVPCVSFSDAIGDSVWDCVKVDIEGAEFETLSAVPAEVFEKQIKFLQVEFHNGWASDEVYRALIGKLESVFTSSGSKNIGDKWNGRYDWANFVRR
jgi:FkbM family methyltransferase